MRFYSRISLAAIAIASSIGLWEHIASGGRWPHIGAVFKALDADTTPIIVGLIATATAVSSSLVLAIVIGLPMGVYIAFPKCTPLGLYAAIAAIRPLPVTILIPVFISTFGLDGFYVPLVALPIVANIAVNTAAAIHSSGQRRRAICTSWGLNSVQYARHVLFFEVMEAMTSTMRIMVPYALAINIALDYFMRTCNGLGAYVAASYERYMYDRMLAGSIVVMTVGLLATAGLDYLFARTQRWKQDM